MPRVKYPTDLTDNQLSLVSSLFEVSYKEGGRPCKHSKREILNAIFYILRTGCQWRYLPHDFPHWTTVYTYFRDWKKNGTFEKMNTILTNYSRISAGRNKEPTAGIIDSQSVKTTERGGIKGYDGGKKNQWPQKAHNHRYDRFNFGLLYRSCK